MLTSIEIIALVLIVVAVVKVFVLLVNPKAWMSFARGVYKNPAVTSLVALILAAIVFYYLIQNGMTIVQILAAAAFVALLFGVGLAGEIPYLLKKYEGLIKKGNLWKDFWLYTLLWMILMILGLIQIFS
ncbi:MAG: hypothetical protein KJ905_02315 [Nanoarchaeota archaeon]|nr:hypothetical protein [Nanoarchaeota archaeon]MBU1501585.1 hypothetical protein [Nanoarchaeota archaeon]MBU2459392.1 hypothetical protein [Nanoarchaeota archaeon]